MSKSQTNEQAIKVAIEKRLTEICLEAIKAEVLSLDEPGIRFRNINAIENSQELLPIFNQQEDCEWIESKDKATYYTTGDILKLRILDLSTPPLDLSTPPLDLSTPPQDLSTPSQDLSTPPRDLSTPPRDLSTPLQINDSLRAKIDGLGIKERNGFKVIEIILELFRQRAVKAKEIAKVLGKGEAYIKRKYLGELIMLGDLVYLYPEMINHPEQAYKTEENND